MRSRSNLKVDLGVLGTCLGGSVIGCYHLKPIFHGEIQMSTIFVKMGQFKMAAIWKPLEIFYTQTIQLLICLWDTVWCPLCILKWTGSTQNVGEPPFMKFISLVCSAWLTSIIFVPFHAKISMIHYVKPLCCTSNSFWDIVIWNFENFDFEHTCDLEK